MATTLAIGTTQMFDACVKRNSSREMGDGT